MTHNGGGRAVLTRLGRAVHVAHGPAATSSGSPALILSAAVLFGVGACSALTLVGDWRRKGLQMVVIGLGAAAIGFLIGRLFHAAG
jgi:VIT1/CCC1 family predicted Fe2+/Mn2+ transporter